MEEHYIPLQQPIDYLIRFQNTGKDTAFTVLIRDELSPWLDPGSVVPGASSHPYEFEYYSDRNLKFTFDNIMLPDSNVNLEGSQGFVSFRVSQIADVPLETDIFNQAAFSSILIRRFTPIQRCTASAKILSASAPGSLSFPGSGCV